jgi:hypothetical protein
MTTRFLVTILVIFAALTALFYGLHQAKPDFNFAVLMGGNMVMAALSLSSYFIVKKQIDSRPQAFVRGVFGGTFLKLMLCMAALLTYILLNRAHIHKPTIFTLFGIYIVYTAAETWMLMKMAKKTN